MADEPSAMSATSPTSVPRLRIDPAALPSWSLRRLPVGTRTRHEDAERWVGDTQLHTRRQLAAQERNASDG